MLHCKKRSVSQDGGETEMGNRTQSGLGDGRADLAKIEMGYQSKAEMV